MWQGDEGGGGEREREEVREQGSNNENGGKCEEKREWVPGRREPFF